MLLNLTLQRYFFPKKKRKIKQCKVIYFVETFLTSKRIVYVNITCNHPIIERIKNQQAVWITNFKKCSGSQSSCMLVSHANYFRWLTMGMTWTSFALSIHIPHEDPHEYKNHEQLKKTNSFFFFPMEVISSLSKRLICYVCCLTLIRVWSHLFYSGIR